MSGGYLFGANSPAVKAAMGYNQRQVVAAPSRQEPRGLRRLPLRGVLDRVAGVGVAAHRGRPLLSRVRVALARRHRAGAGAASLDDVCSSLCWNQLLNILQHSFTCNMHPELPKEQGPNALVAIGLMFVIRPVGGHHQERPSDNNNFMFIYSICLLLASYLVAIMLVQDFIQLNDTVVVLITVILLLLLVLPIAIPVTLILSPKTEHPIEEALLSESLIAEASTSQDKGDQLEVILSEVEEEKPKGIDLLPSSESTNRIPSLQAKLMQAAATGKPHHGENFTLVQASVNVDFWLIWFSLLLGAGSGLAVMDNLGQMSQAVGHKDVHIFVSLTSIWNFLGRVGGGYFSEVIVRECAYPRHIALAVAQILIATAHFLFAMTWPGTMVIGTFLVGLGYGAHWAIVPAPCMIMKLRNKLTNISSQHCCLEDRFTMQIFLLMNLLSVKGLFASFSVL